MLEFLGQWTLSIPGGMVALETMPYFSLILVIYALWVFIHHYQIFNRKKIEGIVRKSELVANFNRGLNKSSMFVYFADLEFEYKVNDESYVGNRTSSLEFNSAVDPFAYKKVRCYPVGRKVSVYVDEDKPEKAIIENLFPYSVYIMGLIAILIYMLHDALVYAIYQNLL